MAVAADGTATANSMHGGKDGVAEHYILRHERGNAGGTHKPTDANASAGNAVADAGNTRCQHACATVPPHTTCCYVRNSLSSSNVSNIAARVKPRRPARHHCGSECNCATQTISTIWPCSPRARCRLHPTSADLSKKARARALMLFLSNCGWSRVGIVRQRTGAHVGRWSNTTIGGQRRPKTVGEGC